MPAHSHDGQIPTKAPLREPAKSRVTSRKQTGTDPFSQPRASQEDSHSQIRRAFSDSGPHPKVGRPPHPDKTPGRPTGGHNAPAAAITDVQIHHRPPPRPPTRCRRQPHRPSHLPINSQNGPIHTSHLALMRTFDIMRLTGMTLHAERLPAHLESRELLAADHSTVASHSVFQ